LLTKMGEIVLQFRPICFLLKNQSYGYSFLVTINTIIFDGKDINEKSIPYTLLA